MQPVRNDAAIDALRDSFSNTLSRSGNNADVVNSPIATLLAQAVAPADESTGLDATAQSVADLQAIIERFAGAVTTQDTISALRDLQAFANDRTNARFAGGVIGELADIADAVIEAVEAYPTALGSGFALDIKADFGQTNYRSDDYVQTMTSFSFSFTLRTENTLMTGAVSFDERFEMSEEGMSYEAVERVSLGLVTFNTNTASNPILDWFNRLTEQLTGVDLGELTDQINEAVAPVLSNGGYRNMAAIELIRLEYSQTTQLLESTETLIDLLREFMAEEPRSIASPMPVSPEDRRAAEARALAKAA